MISEDDISYASGNVDGDGCVSVITGYRKGSGSLEVSVGKAEKSLQILNWFKSKFGGRVNRNRAAKGKYQAIYSWRATGADAIAFCELIQKNVQLKGPQFRLAATFPSFQGSGHYMIVKDDGKNIQLNGLEELKKHFKLSHGIAKAWAYDGKYPSSLAKKWILEKVDKNKIASSKLSIQKSLQRMKHEPHGNIVLSPSSAYFAGCFDSEGNVTVSNLNQIEVALSQKYRAICDALVRQYGGGVTGGGKTCYKWYIKNYEGCMKFIDDILPYSIEKKPQLELVKNMPVNGAPEVAKKLREFKGNQGVGPKEKPERVAQKRLHGLPRYIGEVKGRSKKNAGVVIGYSVQWKAR